MKKIEDDSFWKFAANEWWLLISPYTPMDTGTLWQSVNIHPKEIEYTQPYSHRIYEGNFNFKTDMHPLASRQWDKAAQPTQEGNLIDAMQAYIDSGRLKLND